MDFKSLFFASQSCNCNMYVFVDFLINENSSVAKRDIVDKLVSADPWLRTPFVFDSVKIPDLINYFNQFSITYNIVISPTPFD